MAKKTKSKKKSDSVQELDAKKIQKAKDAQDKENFFKSFYEFLAQYSVIGLAIGLVIGSSTQNVVKQLVDGLITPFISLVMNVFLPAIGPIRDWKITVYNDITFFPGNILQALIEFVIILFIIYFVVKIILRRDDLLEKKKK